jgi:hypothetical protein
MPDRAVPMATNPTREAVSSAVRSPYPPFSIAPGPKQEACDPGAGLMHPQPASSTQTNRISAIRCIRLPPAPRECSCGRKRQAGDGPRAPCRPAGPLAQSTACFTAWPALSTSLPTPFAVLQALSNRVDASTAAARDQRTDVDAPALAVAPGSLIQLAIVAVSSGRQSNVRRQRQDDRTVPGPYRAPRLALRHEAGPLKASRSPRTNRENDKN